MFSLWLLFLLVCLPPLLLFFHFIDSRNSGIWNFSIVVAALAVTVIAKNDQRWIIAIIGLLTILALLLSPLQQLLPRQQPSVRHDNSPSIQFLRPGTPDVAPKVDVVAVHGLGSVLNSAFTHPTSGKNWLRDFLPLDFPDARIMAYTHNSRWDAAALNKSLEDHGRDLIYSLVDVRAQDPDRPLVLVGHSFGGLIIKQALVTAFTNNNDQIIAERNRHIRDAVAGVIFLGTPHQGSNYTLLGRLYCQFNA